VVELTRLRRRTHPEPLEKHPLAGDGPSMKKLRPRRVPNSRRNLTTLGPLKQHRRLIIHAQSGITRTFSALARSGAGPRCARTAKHSSVPGLAGLLPRVVV